MTGREVERDERTASRSSAITRGGSPLMPSHSQGAERRPERRAGHTGSRWLLRALVIGGLAGVAWLLTGSAAHAADQGDEPSGSLLGPVPQFATETELLEAAVQPPESTPKNHRPHAVTSILTAPEQVLSGPVAMLDEVLLDEVAHDGSAIDAKTAGVPRRTATPSPRASGGTADDGTLPVSAGTVAEPVFELPAEISPEIPVADDVTTPAGTELEQPEEPAVTPARVAKVAARAGVTPARKAKIQSRSRVHRHIPAARPASETARDDVPGDDGPVSRRMNLGAVSGIPAGGPGASAEAGPMAVLPARLANGAVDDHRLPLAAGVAARRNDAEAPTVSPD
ncbi:hypothetical protein QLQ12_30430 [Actinoplanes sp. NEAU-A12]|uniref:Secreted protein n=1 Tax=Actinoplanes sandaracinus TaxID=3045177 RepID=A0ABT6WT69_9ACTN|nr:hypothetical protein [Actinoplanes sandaracinus]MDI6099047.1 hypothetical protein [Actinoplanes sandaracinus]MDI6102942.1 hypothetical protein [Actinoplanes sandaracinus]